MQTISLNGKFIFEPENVTKKHIEQSSWKKIAIIEFDGEICEYYQWFIHKRFNLFLNKPLRNAHVSFINDSYNDFLKYDETIWNKFKEEYSLKDIEICLNVSPRTLRLFSIIKEISLLYFQISDCGSISFIH